MQVNRKKALVYAACTVFLWASAYVFTRIALQTFSPGTVSVTRYLFASLFLLVAALSMRTHLPKLRDIPLFFLSGAMGFALYMIFFNEASRTVTAATGSVLIASVPILTAVLARIFLKERLNRLSGFAVVIEFGGILILTLWDGVFSINKGILPMIAAAVLLSGYNLIQRQLTKRYSAFAATAYSIFAGTFLLLVYLPEAIGQVRVASLSEIAVLAFLGLFPSAIAYVFWTKAFSYAEKTSDVTNFMFVTPLLTALLGYTMIAEVPPLSTLVGGAVILTGFILFQYARAKSSPLK